MENNCFVGIQIVTFSAADGERLYDCLKAEKAAAKAKDSGVFIGCQHRYLFGAEIFRDRDTIVIFGWVKQSFTDEEVKSFIAWLKTRAGCREFRMNYNAPVSHLYGDYTYAGNVLVKCDLPEINYPEDDGDRDFGITLESELKKYGEAREIPMS